MWENAALYRDGSGYVAFEGGDQIFDALATPQWLDSINLGFCNVVYIAMKTNGAKKEGGYYLNATRLGIKGWYHVNL